MPDEVGQDVLDAQRDVSPTNRVIESGVDIGQSKELPGKPHLEKESSAELEHKAFGKTIGKIKDILTPREPADNEQEEPDGEVTLGSIQLQSRIAQEHFGESVELTASTKALVEELSNLKIESIDDIEAMNRLLDRIAPNLKSVRAHIDQVSKTTATTLRQAEIYAQAELEKSEFASFEEARLKWQDVQLKLGQLRNQPLGATRHRGEIGKLTQEESELQNLVRLEYPEDVVVSVSDTSIFEQRQALDKLIVDTVSEVSYRIAWRYSHNIQEVRQQVQEGEIQLSEELIDSLNDEFIKTYVLPEIEERKNAFRDSPHSTSAQEVLTILSDQEQVDRAIGLVKQGFNTQLANTQNNEDFQKAQEIRSEIAALPTQLRWIVEGFLKSITPGSKQFQEMARTVKRLPLYSIASQWNDTSEELRILLSDPVLPDQLKYNVPDTMRNLDLHLIDRELDSFRSNVDTKRWELFQKNTEVRVLLGSEEFKKFDSLFEHTIVKNLYERWKSGQERGERVDLGLKLLNGKDPANIPLAILNSFAEPGYSGDRPMVGQSISLEGSPLYKFVLALTPEQINQVVDVPGLTQVIELIKNPKVEKDAAEIQQQLVLIANHYLEAEPRSLSMVLDLFDDIDVGLGEGYVLLENLLYSSVDNTQIKAIKECLLNRTVGFGDQEAARILFERGQGGYELMIERYGPMVSIEQIATNALLKKYFAQEFSDKLLQSILEKDSNPTTDMLEMTQNNSKGFYEALNRLMKFTNNREDFYTKWEGGLLVNDVAIQVLAKHPEKIDDMTNLPAAVPSLFKLLDRDGQFYSSREMILKSVFESESITMHAEELVSVSTDVPQFIELIKEGGPLYTNKDIVIQNILAESGSVVKRAQEIVGIFTKKVPYWKQLFLFTDTRVGDQLASATSGYMIDVLPKIRSSKGKEFDFTEDFSFETKPISEMSVTEKRLIADYDDMTDDEIAELSSLPFSRLKGIHKKMVFAHFLSESIGRSRDSFSKEIADKRNRNASMSLSLQEGTYVHGSAIDYMSSVLLNGNLPGEALGEGAKADSFPFHVDFTRLEQSFLDTHTSTGDALTDSLSGTYGTGGSAGLDGQIFYLYDRQDSTWEAGNEYFAPGREGYHALMLGAMPATEISAVVLRSPETTLENAKRTVLENGFYIPIYNLQGELIFTYEEYDQTVEELNLKVPVEVWDYSLKTGEQLGSNPGASFTVPTDEGPARYYVKFSGETELDHIWAEQLSDEIYRLFELPVPDTKIVRVEGTYGHASRWLSMEERSADDIKNLHSWKDGFLVDSLLANWDIPYAPDRNTAVGSDGKVYRLDNGGSLFFRAKGQRKEQGLFINTVNELEAGTNHERLGQGMRQEYPGLSDEDIQQQARVIQERLTDARIDQLVDSVRLSRTDRDDLKRTLKGRRDYIINRFL